MNGVGHQHDPPDSARFEQLPRFRRVLVGAARFASRAAGPPAQRRFAQEVGHCLGERRSRFVWLHPAARQNHETAGTLEVELSHVPAAVQGVPRQVVLGDRSGSADEGNRSTPRWLPPSLAAHHFPDKTIPTTPTQNRPRVETRINSTAGTVNQRQAPPSFRTAVPQVQHPSPVSISSQNGCSKISVQSNISMAHHMQMDAYCGSNAGGNSFPFFGPGAPGSDGELVA